MASVPDESRLSAVVRDFFLEQCPTRALMMPVVELMRRGLGLAKIEDAGTRHFARLPFAVHDIVEAETFANKLLLLDEGIKDPGGDATKDIAGLDLITPPKPTKLALANILLDLKDAALKMDKKSDAGRLDLADALLQNGGAVSGTTLRSRRLDASQARAYLDDAYGGAGGLTPLFKPLLNRKRPGEKAVSIAAYWTTVGDPSSTRTPSWPTYADLPFDKMEGAERTLLVDSKAANGETSEAIRDAFYAALGALDACARRVPLPCTFAASAGSPPTLSNGAGAEALRVAIAEHTDRVAPAALQRELVILWDRMARWSDGAGWEAAVYQKAVDWVEAIPRLVAHLPDAASPTLAPPPAAAPAPAPAGSPAAAPAQAPPADVSPFDDARVKRRLEHLVRMNDQLQQKIKKASARPPSGGSSYRPANDRRESGQDSRGAPRSGGRDDRPPCFDFRAGKCNRGSACRFAHN